MKFNEMEKSTIFLNKVLHNSSSTEAIKHHIFVLSKWLEDHIEFVMQDTEANKCFRGKLNYSEMKETAADLEIPFDDFHNECRKVLTTNNAQPGFEYKISRNEDEDVDVHPKVFHLIKKEDFNIIYIEVKLKELENNNILLDTAIELLDLQQKTVSIKKERDQEVVQEYKGKRMEEVENTKKDLIKKFAILLNSKKEKILKLQNKLKVKDAATYDDSAEDDDDHEMSIGPSTSGNLKDRRDNNTKAKSRKTNALRLTSDDEGDTVNDEQLMNDDDNYEAQTQILTIPAKRSKTDDGDE